MKLKLTNKEDQCPECYMFKLEQPTVSEVCAGDKPTNMLKCYNCEALFKVK